MSERSKLYKARFSKVNAEKKYSLSEAIKLLKDLPKPKFDETVDIVFRLGIDPKQSDQTVRGAVSLPKGTGKKVRVAVIAEADKANDAKSAGADFVGMEDMIEKIKGGWLDFDVLIATPSAMNQVRTLGKVLGPKGLMPNPKTGTVTDQIANAVKEAKAGRVEFRADKGACVHVPVGKLSFTVDDLLENIKAVIAALIRAKPATFKGVYLLSASISATMSPGLKLDINEISTMKV
ncbi:MAG TPA: 50S ribosomal protein L1 [Victivallales bacterium]|nr:50S ribosomal protein L1 [Victivallales bacterium]